MTIILDPGHGGIDENGSYTTAPNKMHKFPNGEIAYEGYYNRIIAAKIHNILSGIENVRVFSTVDLFGSRDVSLKERVDFVNKFNKKTTLLISLHSNASPEHNARGIELWTSIGRTRADKLAKFIAIEMMDNLNRYDVSYRFDYIHNMYSKEEQFYVLRKTKCPSVLLENLFFDEYKDFELLKNNDFLDDLAISIVEGIMEFGYKEIKKYSD